MSQSSGLRLSLLGGNANNGGNAGPEYSNANNAVTNANANNGSPLNLFDFLKRVCQLLFNKMKQDLTPW